MSLANSEKNCDIREGSSGLSLAFRSERRRGVPSLITCAGAFVVLVALGLIAMVQASPVAGASPETPLACDSCHTVELQSHTALGAGNDACHACHANPNMDYLQLASGTEVALANSVPLCAECHQTRYSAWVAGTHGFPGYKGGKPANASEPQTTCTACHNPHEPRMVLTNVTKPHPQPAPAPPAPPRDALMILGISLAVVAVALVVTVAGRGR